MMAVGCQSDVPWLRSSRMVVIASVRMLACFWVLMGMGGCPSGGFFVGGFLLLALSRVRVTLLDDSSSRFQHGGDKHVKGMMRLGGE